MVKPIGSRAARADNGDARRRKDARITLYIESKRMRRLLEKARRVAWVSGRNNLNAVALRKCELALPVKFRTRARDLLRLGLPSGRNGTGRNDKFGQLNGTDLVSKVESYIGLALAQTAHLIPHPTI